MQKIGAKVNVAEKLSRFGEHWQPRIVGELNGQHVKLVKVPGRVSCGINTRTQTRCSLW